MAEEQPSLHPSHSAASGVLKHPDPPNTFGRCLHNTAEALDMEYQDYMWSPDAKITKDELTEALKFWGMEPPNLVLNIIGPASSDLLYKECLKEKELKSTINELIACRTMAKTGKYEEPPDDYDIEGDPGLFALVTEKLTENIIQMLMSLLSACEQTNSWIQVNENGVSYTDWLVEQALMRCNARPVIIASIGRDWYTGQDESWQTLESNATAIKGKMKVSDLFPVRVPHVKPSSYDNNWPVGYATHYFFVKPDDAGNWFPFPRDWLGPAGTLFVSGGTTCASMMNESIRKLEPTILMKHSGKSCDFFSFAAETVAEGKFASPDLAMKEMTEKYQFWYNREGWDDGGGWLFGEISSNKAPSYMSNVFSAFARNPERFRSAIVVLDAWHTKPETALRRLSACFASTSAVPISGLDTGGIEADEDTLKTAWNLHDALAKNCETVSKRVNFLSISAVALSMVTTSLSVVLTYLEFQDQEHGSKESRALIDITNTVMVILPAIGGLMLQILNRFHYVKKWGAMHMAREQIASEIFKYRAGSGEYDESSWVLHTTEKTSEDSKPQHKSVHRSRDIFAGRVAELFGHIYMHALVDDSLTFQVPIYHPQKKDKEGKTWEDLTEPLLPTESKEPKDQAVDVPLSPAFPVRADRGSVVCSEIDDGFMRLGGEEYFEHRTLPLLHKLQADGPKLAQRLQMYEAFILILSLFSTLLAALDLKLWIPITIAIGTGLTSYMHYEALQARLNAANTSISELTRLVGQWASLGLVEKRTRSVKAMIVEVTENAILRQATAYIAGIATSSFHAKKKGPGNDEKDGKAADGSDKDGGKKKVK